MKKTVLTVSPQTDLELADEISKFYADPLGFVRFAYPWREPGILALLDGPDDWQAEELTAIGEAVRERKFDGTIAVDPIRRAVSSGHGVGKSTISAWITGWILSTRPYSQGTVTANTFSQLQTKTWASIQKWMKLCITAHWFDVGSDRIRAHLAPESWFVSAQTSREENSEAFAGQHAANSTSWYLFDEASAIPDGIWEVAEGGLTDGEPMIFVYGNPTRTHGKFHRVCFGSERGRWAQRIIDSRTCRWTHKELLEEWIRDYGEDSDFVRVRVRGLPPRASDAQYIAGDLVYEAQHRDVLPLDDEPLVCGLDVARGGADSCVFRFRRGPDASSVKPVKILGEEARDSMRLVSTAADVLGRTYHVPDGSSFGPGRALQVKMLFVDETGVGGPIVDRLKQLGHRNVMGVQFGAKSPDDQYANMRAFIWAKMRTWLERGHIDKDARLEADLTGVGYAHDKQDRLLLESKESMKRRGLDSPDDGDALALTFAANVVTKAGYQPKGRIREVFGGAGSGSHSWLG